MSYTNEQLQAIIDTAEALKQANDKYAEDMFRVEAARSEVEAAETQAAASGERVDELNSEFDRLTTRQPAVPTTLRRR